MCYPQWPVHLLYLQLRDLTLEYKRRFCSHNVRNQVKKHWHLLLLLALLSSFLHTSYSCFWCCNCAVLCVQLFQILYFCYVCNGFLSVMFKQSFGGHILWHEQQNVYLSFYLSHCKTVKLNWRKVIKMLKKNKKNCWPLTTKNRCFPSYFIHLKCLM